MTTRMGSRIQTRRRDLVSGIGVVIAVVLSLWQLDPAGLFLFEPQSNATVVAKSHFVTPENEVSIPINTDSALASDIAFVHHDAQKTKIVVTIKDTAKCNRPFLLGRLSGPSIVRISNWTWIQGSNPTRMEASYQAPTPGQYFLEIVALFCDHFFYDFTQKAAVSPITSDWLSNTSGMVELMKHDFQSTCMISPKHNQLTATDASVVVEDTNPRLLPTNKWTGNWKNKNPEKSWKPLHTRYQLEHCWYFETKKKQPIPPDCVQSNAVDRFEDYTFEWNNDLQLDVSKVAQANKTTVCMVGCSHSRGFYEAAQSLGLEEKANIEVQHIPAEYPEDANPKKINHRKALTRPCDILIVAVGQWPASFKDDRPTLLDEYYQAIRNMILKLQGNPRTGPMDLYLRSIHYHSLGYTLSTCPPTDWRSPIVIDAYNLIVERVCRELNVPFLDARAISGPIWDGNPDWNHLALKTSELELLFFLASVFGVTPDGSQPNG